MTNRERFAAILNGEKPDRLPCVEWASWWGLTIERWIEEGLPRPKGKGPDFIQNFFGLDPLRQLWVGAIGPDTPKPEYFGSGIMKTEEDYEKILPTLYQDSSIERCLSKAKEWDEAHQRGDFATWMTLDGFFWFPRMLFGIEPHLYAFYDYPELMHRINQDLVNFHLRCIEKFVPIFKPEYMTIAEDMSYNHGPMLSKELFDEFMAPYYRQVIPALKEAGVHVMIDTDGFLEPLIPWFESVGIEGVLPLERQSGVDVNRIRKNHPNWLMIGGYDKTIMHLGEEAMRKEFERLLPAMKSGRYIPSVDHQTPPDVSIDQYRIYVKLLHEYSEKGV